MDVAINGKQVDIGAALREHVSEHLTTVVGKYFDTAIDSTVTVSRDGSHGFHVDISVHPVRGMLVKGSASANEAYAAFDTALERIAKQLRRYKRRLKEDHGRREDKDALAALQYVLQPEADDTEVTPGGEPTIVAELSTSILPMTVSDAVMRMDLEDAPVVVFRNDKSGVLNVVYRRRDGNIGWIDPSAEAGG
jgi:ribosomal subunit interface protein